MRVDRLLSIILILSNKGKVTGKELAQHFEVSLRTIYRDIDKISQSGIPIAGIGGKGGGFYIMENYHLDNLFLNKGELNTLMAVMDSLNVMFGKNDEFNDIVMKLQNSYRKQSCKKTKLDINISHFSMEDELKEYLFLMNKAIEESRLLIFYYTNRNMEYSKRTVEPIKIEFSQGQWYLTGYCRNRNDYRKFKLVRMKNLRLGKDFIKRQISKEELKQVFNNNYNEESIKVKLRFTSRFSNQLTEHFYKDSIKKSEEDYYIVEEYFSYEEGLIKFILGFGKECEVIEPKYLREDIKKYLKKISKKYND